MFDRHQVSDSEGTPLITTEPTPLRHELHAAAKFLAPECAGGDAAPAR